MAVSEFARCVVSAFLVIYFPQWGIISFAIGQVSTERERERERERDRQRDRVFIKNYLYRYLKSILLLE